MPKSGGGSDYDYIFKLILIGDSSVGKSNLLLRITRNEFRLSTQSTIGVEFAYRQLTIDGKKIKNQIWDTAGQERFKTVVPQLYRGSDGVFAVFDLTRPDTFAHTINWIEEVHRHTSSDLPIILIGNKCDLERKVSREQATALAQQLNLSYMETSALNAANVELAFTTLVTNIYQKKKLQSGRQGPPKSYVEPSVEIFSNPIRVGDHEESTNSKKSGCC